MPGTIAEQQVRQWLDPLRLIAALETAFRDRFHDFVIPARSHLETRDGVFLTMPCYDRGTGALGMKQVVVHRQRLPRVQAMYTLLDPETAAPKLLISANYLTDLRTAATSALATKFLAVEHPRTLGIFGAGRQALAHLKVLPLVHRYQRALVCSSDPEQTRKFVETISPELSTPVEPADAATCAANSDVICACTTSTKPLFDGRLLRPGTHVNAVGAFQPHTRELDSETACRARVFVDTYDGALAEAGDLLIPIREGRILRSHILADLHELVSGKKPGRQTPTDITLFKSVGCALEDLVAAELVQHSYTSS